MSSNEKAIQRLNELADLLDIPESYYELARRRYHALSEWFEREESEIKQHSPSIYPQGSFRYGTVIRPLAEEEEYDLDLVTELLDLAKTDLTQFELKCLVGDEVKGYAKANGIKEPVSEKPRCWRLDYADTVKFHMDVLPAIPEGEGFKDSLKKVGVLGHLADMAISITDRRHPQYKTGGVDWPSSNPKGYAGWFEERMRSAAEPRIRTLVKEGAYASVEDVPVSAWKTPLQRSIQVLKRHRDLMFQKNPDVKPISMIITTLSAHAYNGESNLYDAIMGILERMPEQLQPSAPRVPNPVNPAEDFADKWKSDDRLERNFWLWHKQAKADLARLADELDTDDIQSICEKRFGLTVPEKRAKELADTVTAPVVVAPAVTIKAPPKPWLSNG